MGLALLLSVPNARAQDRDLAWMDMGRPMLQVAVELASDAAVTPGADRQQLLDALYKHLEGMDAEHTFAQDLLTQDPDSAFTALGSGELKPEQCPREAQ